MSTILQVNLGPRSYDIAIVDAAAGLGEFARQRSRGGAALVVTDENVAAHGRSVESQLQSVGFRTRLAILPAGEGQKSLDVAKLLYDELLELLADRHTLVVAVGGGVTGDLAGFVASTFARGLPLLMAPTTLLAMVDSSVGGKVAVNLPRAKNMVGTFHQPVGVWIDTAFLDTLPPREYRSGLAEIVKYGVILDEAFFEYQEKHVAAILARETGAVRHLIRRSCELKAHVVEHDEREETGLRAVLNYGHTFAHAFETAGGYGAWLHGEAVAAGMICASRLAERRGLIAPEVTERQIRLLRSFELPVAPRSWPIDGLIATMKSDKKAVDGQMRFILPTRLGNVALFKDVPESAVREILREMMQP
ncbi:MAG: 3-dehydroquinate synthase [Planctomycetota bacterium]